MGGLLSCRAAFSSPAVGFSSFVKTEKRRRGRVPQWWLGVWHAPFLIPNNTGATPYLSVYIEIFLDGGTGGDCGDVVLDSWAYFIKIQLEPCPLSLSSVGGDSGSREGEMLVSTVWGETG